MNFFNRRKFLATIASTSGVVSCNRLGAPDVYWEKPSISKGHKVLSRFHEKPTNFQKKPIAIIGGGVSGLSTAYHLEKLGIADYSLFELEDSLGGNSVSSSNGINSYPCGAHYLPVPDMSMPELLEFLEELHIIKGYSHKKPVIDPIHLCHAPDERLFCYGTWKPGIKPYGIEREADRQFDLFAEIVQHHKLQDSLDQNRLFSIPISRSINSKEKQQLVSQSFRKYLDQKNLKHPLFRYYIKYCMLDDYGTTDSFVSAYAGLHYFCSRIGKVAGLSNNPYLTWENGNGFLIDGFHQLLQNKPQTGQICLGITQSKNSYILAMYDSKNKNYYSLESQIVVLATQSHVAKRILGSSLGKKLKPKPHFPWATLQIQTEDYNLNGRGAPLSWDNVSLHGTSLGYISANHQKVSNKIPQRKRSHLTLYSPLTALQECGLQTNYLPRRKSFWSNYAKSELERTHHGISNHIRSIGISLWQHAMTAPLVGDNLENSQNNKLPKNIFLSHTDYAGISIFEEAFYQGHRSALSIRKIL